MAPRREVSSAESPSGAISVALARNDDGDGEDSSPSLPPALATRGSLVSAAGMLALMLLTPPVALSL